MHIAVDVGNTTIAFAVVDKNKILAVKRIDTNVKKESLRLQLAGVLRGFKRRYGKFDQAIICSVVPRISGMIKNAVKAELGAKVFVVGEDVKVAMVNRYKNPRQVGQDRLVGAYAAMMLYGKPAIIIDLGTAITFNEPLHQLSVPPRHNNHRTTLDLMLDKINKTAAQGTITIEKPA